MYRNYLMTLQSTETAAVSNNHPSHDGAGDKQIVDGCWKKVYQQIDSDKEKEDNGAQISKIVRVFVSSTFTDFHQEREVLVKRVFPALREHCAARGLSLFECDLRWGIPGGTSTADTVATCMDALDRCREETAGMPFFINLVGERYGWVPGPQELGEDLRNQYHWVDGTSITFMEVMHGAIKSRNPNAGFFIRKSSYLDQLSLNKHQLGRYRESGSLGQLQLQRMKTELRYLFPDAVIEYDCSVEESSEDKFTLDLKEFEKSVLDFLIKRIDIMHPVVDATRDESAIDKENRWHQLHVDYKSSLVIGREQELMHMEKYISGDVTADDVDKPLAVTASPGFGKSSLLSLTIKRLTARQDVRLAYHCVGASGRSTDKCDVLRRLLQQLKRHDDPESGTTDWSQTDMPGLLMEWQDWLEKHRDHPESNPLTVIVVDALDEILHVTWSDFDWLPDALPLSIRLIVSCSSAGSLAYNRVSGPGFAQLRLSDFSMPLRLQLVQDFFLRYSKKLDTAQAQSLTSHSGACNPLWLVLSCEELRVHGQFRSLTQKIASLPDDLDGLLSVITDRLIAEDKTEQLLKALKLLASSPYGLSEDAMPLLLGDLAAGVRLPPLTWAGLRRVLGPFLKVSLVGLELRLKLFHGSLYKVISQRFLTGEQVAQVHTHLADYYQHHHGDGRLVVDELLYHLEQGCLRGRTLQFLRKDFSSSVISAHTRRLAVMRLRCMNHIHNTPKSDKPKSNRLMLCRNCSMRPGLFSPTAAPAGDVCLYCAMHVFRRPGDHLDELYTCRRCARHGGLAEPDCLLCGRPVFSQGVFVKQCTTCSAGAQWRCANILTD